MIGFFETEDRSKFLETRVQTQDMVQENLKKDRQADWFMTVCVVKVWRYVPAGNGKHGSVYQGGKGE